MANTARTHVSRSAEEDELQRGEGLFDVRD